MRRMWNSYILKTISLFGLMLFVLGCNKVERFNKRLSGNWTIEQFQFTNQNGLSYYYPAEGEIIFTPEDDTTGKYSLDYSYVVDGITIQNSESGRYVFAYGDQEFYDLYRTKNGIQDTIKNARVILLTKTDLRTEMTEFIGRRTFVFVK